MSCDNTAETDAYYDKIHSYVKSLDLSTRRAAPWTLSQLHLEISGRVTQAVKEKTLLGQQGNLFHMKYWMRFLQAMPFFRTGEGRYEI